MDRGKILEDPVFKEILLRVAGENGYEVVAALAKGEATDEELAKRTGIRINLVRRILYDLYENRVVSYRRIRDEDSGWYIYYWRIEPERALEYFTNNKRLLLQKLQERLEQERATMYFSCSRGCVKLSFDDATENDFKCPQCGEKLEYFDNSSIINALERQIENLRQSLTES